MVVMKHYPVVYLFLHISSANNLPDDQTHDEDLYCP